MLSAFWLLLGLAYLIHGLVAASPASRAAPDAPPSAGDPPSPQPVRLALATTQPTERMVEIPESILNEIYKRLGRLEVLERREQMRLVQRADRKGADTRGRLSESRHATRGGEREHLDRVDPSAWPARS